jgi:hypothetical protein
VSRILIAVLVLLLAPAALAQNFSSLEERMSAAEFAAAGLDKLSSEELARLNAWLAQNSLQGSASAFEARRGGAGEPSGSAFSARLVGEFRGWNGSTRFELDNGQVWEVNDPGASLVTRVMSSPTVRISRGMLSAWFLKVEGYNAAVKVKRVN